VIYTLFLIKIIVVFIGLLEKCCFIQKTKTASTVWPFYNEQSNIDIFI